MNMTVKDLKEIVNKLPDDMEVIIPVIDEYNADDIQAFRLVRTAGVLEADGERPALCLNSSSGGNISDQVEKSDAKCT